ncbi:hypothetical protein P170DRAFT_471583 [Aspergillus steynii IBT 23096]|uniref:Uncharacterized protein n=1 Tax=Aspergillus steynii IBT 23096 TaxID=1392250 RepID=A0A2I2GFK0_9EURO|nr:uncharacterized protein P170DRAFT_471583 [Aspergillus steynii IBT 23096]PLB51654.1 hypothetical protein P170DRAFT_471583 [Aspergillus steynii IBT 23096]
MSDYWTSAVESLISALEEHAEALFEAHREGVYDNMNDNRNPSEISPPPAYVEFEEPRFVNLSPVDYPDGTGEWRELEELPPYSAESPRRTMPEAHSENTSASGEPERESLSRVTAVSDHTDSVASAAHVNGIDSSPHADDETADNAPSDDGTWLFQLFHQFDTPMGVNGKNIPGPENNSPPDEPPEYGIDSLSAMSANDALIMSPDLISGLFSSFDAPIHVNGDAPSHHENNGSTENTLGDHIDNLLLELVSANTPHEVCDIDHTDQGNGEGDLLHLESDSCTDQLVPNGQSPIPQVVVTDYDEEQSLASRRSDVTSDHGLLGPCIEDITEEVTDLDMLPELERMRPSDLLRTYDSHHGEFDHDDSMTTDDEDDDNQPSMLEQLCNERFHLLSVDDEDYYADIGSSIDDDETEDSFFDFRAASREITTMDRYETRYYANLQRDRAMEVAPAYQAITDGSGSGESDVDEECEPPFEHGRLGDQEDDIPWDARPASFSNIEIRGDIHSFPGPVSPVIDVFRDLASSVSEDVESINYDDVQDNAHHAEVRAFLEKIRIAEEQEIAAAYDNQEAVGDENFQGVYRSSQSLALLEGLRFSEGEEITEDAFPTVQHVFTHLTALYDALYDPQAL